MRRYQTSTTNTATTVTAFKASYSSVFHLVSVQDSEISKLLLKTLLEQLNKEELINNLEDEYDQQTYKQLIFGLTHCEFRFFPKHGSVVVMTKDEVFKPTEVYLVFPEAWQLNSLIKTEDVYYISSNPKNLNCIQVGTINNSSSSLSTESQYYFSRIQAQISYQQSLQIKDKQSKSHHTPTLMLEICKHALKIANMIQIPPRYHQTSLTSRGGSMDVGSSSGSSNPNTAFQVLKALLEFFCQDHELVYLMMVELRVFLLLQEKKNQKQMTIKDLQNYQSCLLLVGKQLQKTNAKRFKSHRELCKSRLTSIRQWLDEYSNIVPQQAITARAICQSVEKYTNHDNLKFNSIANYDIDQQILHNLKGNLGFNKNITIPVTCSDLLSSYSEMDQKIWIMQVEDFFFLLAAFYLNQDQIEIPLDQSQMLSTSLVNFSPMHRLVRRYQSIIEDQQLANKYGLKLSNQSWAHMFLIKYIAAVVVFETIKKQRSQKTSNLEKYRIQLRTQTLFEDFYSLNYLGRQALQALIKYQIRNNQKDEIFRLEGANGSFYQYANIIANEQQRIINWKQASERWLEAAIRQLNKQFKQFGEELDRLQKIRDDIFNQPCECYELVEQQWLPIVRRNPQVIDKYTWMEGIFKERKTFFQCSRCIRLRAAQQALQQHKQKSFIQIRAPFPRHDINLYGFLSNIPADIVSFMKIQYDAQITSFTSNISNSLMFNNFFSEVQKYGLLGVYSAEVHLSSRKYLKYYMRNASQFVVYPSRDTINYYCNICNRECLPLKLLSPQYIGNHYYQNLYQSMINSIDHSEKEREHLLYAQMNKLGSIQDQKQYVNLGSIRIGRQTQLSVLAEVLKNRDITINTIVENELPRSSADYDALKTLLVILNASSDLKAMKHVDHSTKSVQMKTHVLEALEDLLKTYLRKWQFKDISSLHLIGKTFTLFAKQIHRQDIAIQVIQRCFAEYEKFVKQNGKTDTSIKFQLSYFLHGALSFYTQDLTFDLDKKAVHTWMKIVILYRVNKVFSAENTDCTKYITTMNYYEYYRDRAIFKNVTNVKNYFKDHPSQLTQLVRLADHGISQNTKWKRDKSLGAYVFKGVHQDTIYQLNFYTGVLLKNGAESTGLSAFIREHPKFISVFGKGRDLQIYPESDGSLRTSCNFCQFFPNQPNCKVFFEFKTISNDLIIRMIIKHDQEESKYVMMTQSQVDDSNFVLPLFYLKQFDGWYCKAKGLMIYRGKSLQKMKQIGLVQIIDKDKLQTDGSVILKDSRIVEQNYRKQNIQYLTKKQHYSFFSHLSIVKKNIKTTNQAIKILKSIEHQEYILQTTIHSKETNKTEIKFWLHRYNLNFTLCSQKGLLSDNFQGYAVSQFYKEHKLLPFHNYCQVNCLVLKKIDNNLRFVRNHEYMVLIPDTPITQEKEKNPIPKGQTVKMKCICYQIHDHFKDIRGKRRYDQLHLACLLAACYCQNFEPLGMSHIQYAMCVLRSCLSSKPLSNSEMEKLKKLLQIAIIYDCQPFIMQCQAVYKSSIIMKHILPFNNQPITVPSDTDKYNIFVSKQELLEHCKYQYRSSKREGNLSVRQLLSPLQQEAISFTHFEQSPYEKKMQRDRKKVDIGDHMLKIIDSVYQAANNELKTYQQFANNILNSTLSNEASIKNPQESRQENIELRFDQSCYISQEQKNQINESLYSFKMAEQQNDKLIINMTNKSQYQDNFSDTLEKMKSLKQLLTSTIEETQINVTTPFDLMMKQTIIIKQRDFTSFLCEERAVQQMNKKLSPQSVKILKNMILLWLKLTVQIGSLERIILILKEKDHLDQVSLRRQLQSPRQEIYNNIPWLCFEAEMKTQIWKSQLQTYKLLIKSETGTFTQLNMGEGKTQVIIPMMVLNEVYNRKLFLPRVNILSPLYKQAQDNYYKFLSVTGFRINIIPIYFNRTVDVKQINIHKMQYAIHLFRKKSLILVDRDSRLSMILKIREEYGFKHKLSENNNQIIVDEKCNKNDRWFFRNMPVFDIFDEVDALMTPKKSFVYAVGDSTPLPTHLLRFQYSKLLLQIMVQKMLPYLRENDILVIEQSYESSLRSIGAGSFPKGFRIKRLNKFQVMSLRTNIVKYFLSSQYIPDEFEFYKALPQQSRQKLEKYLIDQSESINQIQNENVIPHKVHNQILTVRGLISYGILEHCLSLRNGVDYGAPGPEHLKRIGVPYEAADVPSKRSQYSHPEVATMLSFLSYFSKGLTYRQFEEVLSYLMKQSSSFRDKNFNSWLECIENIELRPKNVTSWKQINVESPNQKRMLYECFKFNRNTISFWLICCVFPKDLAQFVNSITASSWDLASSKNSVGFSGTKDTRWLMPEYLHLGVSPNHEIKGTDGKMIYLMLKNTLGVSLVKENSDELWKRFVETSLELQVGCIIDAGAVLAGKSLELKIVPWIVSNELFKKMNFKGILYCNENGEWKVYDVQSHVTIDRDTNIPQHETFVIFDEARTRGADIKMKTQTVAALSLGPNMTKDKMMQAVGRLRKFGRNQKIQIIGTQQIFSTMKDFNINQLGTIEKTKTIIEWVCQNSVKDNQKMMFPNTKLAWLHFENIFHKDEVVPHTFVPDLDVMYQDAIIYERLEVINNKRADDFIKKYQTCKQINDLVSTIQSIGNGYMVKLQNLEDICQRQIQLVKQTETEVISQTIELVPIPEEDKICPTQNNISTINVKLNNSLHFSQNFIHCTQQRTNNIRKKCGKYNLSNNELCKIHFVLVSGIYRTITVVTQREVDTLHQEGAQIIGPKTALQEPKDYFIVRFSDLTLKTPFVRKYNLEQALTDAQFFNGQQNYEDVELLCNTIRNNLSKVRQDDTQKLVYHFLERRGTVQDLYFSSDLEKVYKKMMNSL